MDEAGTGADVTYTRRDRTGLETRSAGTDGRITITTYDRNANKLTETVGNRKTSYTYGASAGSRGLVTHVEVGDTLASSPEISADFSYDADGRLATITRNSSPALVTTYSYNAVGRINQIRTVRGSSDVMQDFDYYYDAAGNVRKIDKQLRTTTALSAVETSEFTYDGQNRVLTDDLPHTDKRTYVFDTTGRLDKVENAECATSTWLENYTYETTNPNQLTEHAIRSLSAAPTCTVNATSADSIVYGDDTAGKPTGAITTIDHPSGSDQEYRYDALNRQTQAISGATTETITHDSLDRVHTMTSGTDSVSLNYTADTPTPTAEGGDTVDDRVMLTGADGQRIGETRSDSTTDRYTLTDMLGSTIATTDTTGAVTATLDYDTYGEPIPAGTGLASDADGEIDDAPYQYTGARSDVVGNTTHHGAREYQSALRLWAQTDQFFDPGDDQGLADSLSGLNRQLYAASNPIGNVDSDGHLACLVQVRQIRWKSRENRENREGIEHAYRRHGYNRDCSKRPNNGGRKAGMFRHSYGTSPTGIRGLAQRAMQGDHGNCGIPHKMESYGDGSVKWAMDCRMSRRIGETARDCKSPRVNTKCFRIVFLSASGGYMYVNAAGGPKLQLITIRPIHCGEATGV